MATNKTKQKYLTFLNEDLILYILINLFHNSKLNLNIFCEFMQKKNFFFSIAKQNIITLV